MALKILRANGFDKTFNISGGYKTYAAAIAPIRKPSPVTHDKHLTHHHRSNDEKDVLTIDACGMQCPGPILKLKKAMDELPEGHRVSITSTDAGFLRDSEAWCNTTGNIFINKSIEKGKYTVLIEKGSAQSCNVVTSCDGKGKTFIVFSDDLDKVLATFILANGAAATGQKVSLFFTFWGLNALKKEQKPKVKKDFIAKMFSMMLPSNSKKLNLSKMSMWGMGRKMMRYVMKQKNIESLESLRAQALEQGVEFIACQMSMDVMGINREELMDELTIGGVATYMDRAEQANVNLFI